MILRKFSSIVLVLFLATSASASVPSHFMIRQISKGKASLKKVEISGTISTSDDGESFEPKFKETFVLDVTQGKLESRISDMSGNELMVFGRDLRSPDGKQGVATELFLDPEFERIFQFLIKKSLPVRAEADSATEVTVLRRWNDRYFWLIGSRAKDSSSAELWVEKDSFKPFRFIFSDGNELQFVQFKGYAEFDLPMEMTVIEDGKMALRYSVNSVEINSAKKYPAIKKNQEIPATVSSDLKKWLEKFYLYVR